MAENADANEKGAWLGLLKWSLKHVDGTVPSEDSPAYQAMSDEDKTFLEEVMMNGIINEGDRMKTILNMLVEYLDSLNIDNDKTESESDSKSESESETKQNSTIEEIEELLFELQDIVEQIDFAQSFAAMGGIPFLIGCASQIKTVPKSIRAACLAILGTLCQNNPSVQFTMLEQGNVPKVINIYFADIIISNAGDDTLIRAKAMQAMSCCIRNHHAGEEIFCMNEQGRKMIENALMEVSSDALRRKAIFFLQALITSDSANMQRVRLFTDAIQYIASNYLDPVCKNKDKQGQDSEEASSITNPPDLRETSLSMIVRILEQKKSVDAIIDIKSDLVGLGIKRISALRALQGEEKEMAEEELRLWESLITYLSRAVKDS